MRIEARQEREPKKWWNLVRKIQKMSSEPTLNLQQAPPSPALTAQRTRSHRIQYAGCFVVFLLVMVYAFDHILQQYSSNPTNENLLLTVIMIFPFLAGFILLAYFLVPKVEFFENHLVARSMWGFSRTRSYPEISKLEVKRQHLFVTFKDRAKIAFHPEEIKLDDLARWLAERDVTAARDLIAARDVQWEPRRTSQVWGPKQKAFSPATLQNKATSDPLGTLKAPLWARLVAGVFFGGILLLNVIAAVAFAQAYFRNPTAVLLFFTVFMTLSNFMWIAVLAWMLIPKEDLYEDHVLIRSMWGRSEKRSYQEITEVAEDEKYVYIIFNDGQLIGRHTTNIDVAGLARFLADRGVTAARDVKWKPQLEESPSILSLNKPKGKGR